MVRCGWCDKQAFIPGDLPPLAALHHAHYWTDAVILVAGIAVWTLIVKWTLEISGSALPRIALRRLGLGSQSLRA